MEEKHNISREDPGKISKNVGAWASAQVIPVHTAIVNSSALCTSPWKWKGRVRAVVSREGGRKLGVLTQEWRGPGFLPCFILPVHHLTVSQAQVQVQASVRSPDSSMLATWPLTVILWT